MSAQRRRRSSFSQHIQRVFHYERQSNVRFFSDQAYARQDVTIDAQKKRQSDSLQSHPNAYNPSVPPKKADIPSERTGMPLVPDNAPIRQRPYSFNSKNTDLSQSSLRHASQEYLTRSLSTRASPATSDTFGESEMLASPTWSGTAKGKEKRASKRLEEERKENERRFRKLEEAELANEHTGLKRESRRLTKKQPIGRSSRSSRSSSVSSDKSRTSITNFTSLFSSSKNAPRSRSNSKTRDQRDSGEWTATELVQTNDDTEPQPGVRPPSINLPERFGTAISSKLALASNALLPLSTEQPNRTVTEPANTTKPSKSSGAVEEQTASWQNGVIPRSFQKGKLDDQEKAERDSQTLPSTRSSEQQQHLDRLSFSANLNPKKKDNGNPTARFSNTASSPLPREEATRSANQAPDSIQRLPASGTLRVHDNDQPFQDSPTSDNHAGAATSSASSSPVQGNSPKPSPPREFIGGYRYKKFKSSPLAAAPTTSESIDTSSESQIKEDTPLPDNSVKSMSMLTYPENPTSRLASLNHREKGSKKLRKLPSTSSNASKKTATGSWADLLSDARSASRAPQRSGRSSVKDQENRLQVLSWPDSRSENAKQPSRQPKESRFYGGHIPASNTRGLNGLRSPQPRPLSTKSDPAVRNVLTDSKPDASQIHPALRVRNHTFQFAEHHSSNTEIVQPKEMSNGISSRRASQDSHSEDYNTADEASSIAESYFSVAQNHPPGTSSQGHSPGDWNDRKVSSSSVNKIPVLETPGSPRHQAKPPTGHVNNLQQGQLVAKVFVICCQCGFWHDVPSEVYPQLARPSSSTNHPDTGNPTDEANRQLRQELPGGRKERSTGTRTNSLSIQAPRREDIPRSSDLSPTSSIVVHCSWCDHDMSSLCCQRWTTVVHLRKRNY